MSKLGANAVIGRRHLVVLAGAAVLTRACGSASEAPIGGPFGGTGVAPAPDGGSGTDPATGGAAGSGNGGSSGGGGNGGGSGASGEDAGAIQEGGGARADSGGAGGDDAGPPLPACQPPGTIFAVTFAKYPQLKNVGESVSVSATGYSDPSCHKSNILVAQTSPGVFIAFSQSCPHACCLVSFSGTGFNCPCHGAAFDLTGACTNGRAPAPLASLPVCADSTGVYVTIG